MGEEERQSDSSQERRKSTDNPLDNLEVAKARGDRIILRLIDAEIPVHERTQVSEMSALEAAKRLGALETRVNMLRRKT